MLDETISSFKNIQTSLTLLTSVISRPRTRSIIQWLVFFPSRYEHKWRVLLKTLTNSFSLRTIKGSNSNGTLCSTYQAREHCEKMWMNVYCRYSPRSCFRSPWGTCIWTPGFSCSEDWLNRSKDWGLMQWTVSWFPVWTFFGTFLESPNLVDSD